MIGSDISFDLNIALFKVFHDVFLDAWKRDKKSEVDRELKQFFH